MHYAILFKKKIADNWKYRFLDKKGFHKCRSIVEGNVQSAWVKERGENMWEKSLSAKRNYSIYHFDQPDRSSFFRLGSYVIHILTTNLPCKKPRCISQAIAKNSFERCFQIIKKIYRTKWPILNILIIAIYNTLVLN